MSCYHYLRTSYNLIIDPPIDRMPRQNNEGVLQRFLTIHNLIVDQQKIAKAKRHYVDQLSTPKQFNVGEKVVLNTQNLKLFNQPSKKFRSRYIGPYTQKKN